MLCRLETCLMLAAVAASAFGAGDQEAIHVGPVYTSFTVFPEVRVLVTVPSTATKDTLTPSAFSLKVDNGPASVGTQVQTLAESGLGMSAVVMLDVSGSMMGGPLNAIRAGLVKFTSEATLGDLVAICTVAEETRWDANWNDTGDQLKAALVGLKARGTLTRLWDGLLEVIAKYPETPLARRLVVISDGHDEGSQHTLEQVIVAATQQHVVIDSIGMTRGDPKFLANLARLSSETGGLHRPALSLTMLEQLVGGGIKRYRTIPVVTFRAEGVPADGKMHPFAVTWTGAAAPLQSQVEALVPEDPKAVPVPTIAEPVKVETPPPPEVDKPQESERVPKLWLYVGAGVLAALALGLIAFLTMRKPKQKPKPVFQQPLSAPTQVPPTQPVYYPDPPAPAFMPGSVYMPLAQEPARPSTWFAPPAKLKPSAWLVCIEGPAVGKSFAIDEPQFWIGASPNNQLVLEDDPTVSGNHACIAFENDSLRILDHRSTNGLFVNDQRLADNVQLLQPGDRLRVGRSIFVLRPNDAA